MVDVHGVHRRSSLYYVEGVTQINEPVNNHNIRQEQNGILTAYLQYIPLNIDEWIKRKRDFKWYIKVPVTAWQREIVHEGSYVYYTKGDGFLSAGNDERVRKIVEQSENTFSKVEDLIDRNHDFPDINNITRLYSYHVNVGHGNLSLLVFEHDHQIKIWMIDGSNFDFIVHRYHSSEIESCLEHIVKKFGLCDKPHIDVLMITHAHYDHYSAIKSFIEKGLIDTNTLVYLYVNKKIKSFNFNNLLTLLIENKMTIIPPFVQNSSSNIEILYPDKNTFSDSLEINNTSSVYRIQFDGVSYFVFPGDIETKGWDLMDYRCCEHHMKGPKYYAISHHGSENGHIRHPKCPICSVKSVADCLPFYTKVILMGRDKAFNGIYSERVLSDFHGRIYLSERDDNKNAAKFLEIDLISGKEVWY